MTSDEMSAWNERDASNLERVNPTPTLAIALDNPLSPYCHGQRIHRTECQIQARPMPGMRLVVSHSGATVNTGGPVGGTPSCPTDQLRFRLAFLWEPVCGNKAQLCSLAWIKVVANWLLAHNMQIVDSCAS